MRFINAFEFRCLRQNRRVVAGDEDRTQELDDFHEVLSDISWCRETAKVRQFIVEAYVRGAAVGSAERAELDGSTAAFCKRMFFFIIFLSSAHTRIPPEYIYRERGFATGGTE